MRRTRRAMNLRRSLFAVLIVASVAMSSLAIAAPAFADVTRYRTPPPAIEAALNAPALPSVFVSPRRDVFALVTPLRYPPVADLARPMLRIAGLRIGGAPAVPRPARRRHRGEDAAVSLGPVAAGNGAGAA
jgi:hypothetical protein